MILALKTSGATTEMRLLQDGGSDSTVTWDSGRQLADGLLGRIEGILADHHALPSDLTGIVVFSGPGSFTSLRIGHTVANALADSLGIPVVGAMGDDWLRDGAQRIGDKPSGPALPHYGAEAHITKSKTRRGEPES